jgi:hypothetical protein
MKGMNWCLGLGLALCLLAGGGCSRGPRLAEVAGTVTLDGKPLDNVLVEFLPEAGAGSSLRRSTGRTDADGHFQLTCDNQKPGAVIGAHRVLVHDLAPYGDKFVGRGGSKDGPDATDRPPSRVPDRYTQVSQTPLHQDVQEGPQTVQINLTTP